MFLGCPFVFQCRFLGLFLLAALAYLADPTRSANASSKREIKEALDTIHRFLKSPEATEWLAKRATRPFVGTVEEILEELSEASEANEEVQRAAKLLQSASESAEISLFIPENPTSTDSERKSLSAENEAKTRTRRSDVVCLQDHDVIAVTRTAYDWQWFLRKVIPAYTVHLALEVGATGSRRVICLEKTPVYLPKSRRTPVNQISTIMDVARNVTVSGDSIDTLGNSTEKTGSRSNTDLEESETPEPEESSEIDAKLLQEEDLKEGVEEENSEELSCADDEESSCMTEEDDSERTTDDNREREEVLGKEEMGENDGNMTKNETERGEENIDANNGNEELSTNDDKIEEIEPLDVEEDPEDKTNPEDKEEETDFRRVHDWVWDIDEHWELPPVEWWNVTDEDWDPDLPIVIEQALRRTNPPEINDWLSGKFSRDLSNFPMDGIQFSKGSPRRSLVIGNKWQPVIHRPQISEMSSKEKPCGRPIVLLVPSPRIIPVRDCRYPCPNPPTRTILQPGAQGVYPSALIGTQNWPQNSKVQDLLRRRKILLARYLEALKGQNLIRKLQDYRVMSLRQRSKLNALLTRWEKYKRRTLLLRRLNALLNQRSKMAFALTRNPRYNYQKGIIQPQTQRQPFSNPTKISAYSARQRPLLPMSQFGYKPFENRFIPTTRPCAVKRYNFMRGILPGEVTKSRTNVARFGLYNLIPRSSLSNRLSRHNARLAKIKDNLVRNFAQRGNQGYLAARNIAGVLPLQSGQRERDLYKSRLLRQQPMGSTVNPSNPRLARYYAQKPTYDLINAYPLRNGRSNNGNGIARIPIAGNAGRLDTTGKQFLSPSANALTMLRNPRISIRGKMPWNTVLNVKTLLNRPEAKSFNPTSLYTGKLKPLSSLNQPRFISSVSPSAIPNSMMLNLTPREMSLVKQLWQIFANRVRNDCQPQTCYSPCQAPCNKPVKIHISVKGPVNEPIRLFVRPEPNEGVEIVPENAMNLPNFNRRSMQPLRPEEFSNKNDDFVFEDEPNENNINESNAMDEVAEKIRQRMKNEENIKR